MLYYFPFLFSIPIILQYWPINSTILLLKNSDTLNVDLNAKDHEGGTAFHYACSNGQLKLAKLLMKNSIEFNIELEHIDNDGRLVSNSDYPLKN